MAEVFPSPFRLAFYRRPTPSERPFSPAHEIGAQILTGWIRRQKGFCDTRLFITLYQESLTRFWIQLYTTTNGKQDEHIGMFQNRYVYCTTLS